MDRKDLLYLSFAHVPARRARQIWGCCIPIIYLFCFDALDYHGAYDQRLVFD